MASVTSKLPSALGGNESERVVLVYNLLLVVEDDVREPDVGGGNMETVPPAVLLGVPAQLVVVPVLLYPQVGRHHLLTEVLQHQPVRMM